jgi:hypothetical protein
VQEFNSPYGAEKQDKNLPASAADRGRVKFRLKELNTFSSFGRAVRKNVRRREGRGADCRGRGNLILSQRAPSPLRPPALAPSTTTCSAFAILIAWD